MLVVGRRTRNNGHISHQVDADVEAECEKSGCGMTSWSWEEVALLDHLNISFLLDDSCSPLTPALGLNTLSKS